ncbi:MAG: metallophosphoesterase [Archangium gephyra]|uniref:Metallophosphoesterase n=1 Tax=Archangium gephyra TaxID=48 RepID=A0A2W5T4A1_9BACT|nr:MAG: metallophosphoesterase [Archangium gephyra]
MSETRDAGVRDVPVLLFVRGFVLLSIAMTLVVGLHWYLGLRLIDDAQVPQPFATGAWTLLWTFLLSLFGGFLGGRFLPRPIAKVAQWFGFVWMGAFGLLVVATGVSDLAFWAVSKTTTLDSQWPVWRAVGVMALVIPALAWGFWISRRPETKRITVDIPGLDKSLDGYRIAQISDVHIGETLDRTFAQLVTDQVNALNADAVVVTGDMIDGSVNKLRDEVAPLGGLRGKHGVFYVTGNHEYYHGGSAWEAEARRLGFNVLHNEHRVVGDGKLVIGGVTDVEGRRFSEAHASDVNAAFANAPAGVPRVLLCHQPRFASAAKDSKVSLMLSGHTHGGQIFPFMFFVKLQQPVIGGFEVIDGVPTYTSNGTGYWGPPFRIGPRGEVTEITLRAV